MKKYQNILLVEGKTDFHFIMALCEIFGIEENFKVQSSNNDQKCLMDFDTHIDRYISSTIKSTDQPANIGLILDADECDIESRWQSICRILIKNDYKPPVKAQPTGTIIESSENIGPRVGIWIMPNNADTGILEDFCLKMAPADAIKFAEECVLNAAEKKISSFKKNHKSKAILHTYLSWQDEPGRPIGTSITSRNLSTETGHVVTFIEFIRKVFN